MQVFGLRQQTLKKFIYTLYKMKRKGYTQGALVDERKGLIKCTNFKRLQGQVFLFIDNMWYTNFICTKKQEKRPLGR